MRVQGIPALSWVVFAIIWFHGIEFRIFFIMVVTSLPAFTFQVLDALRGMSKDLFEMVLAFRPTRRKLSAP
jgi:NitT/TauT family transport system permease protein